MSMSLVPSLEQVKLISSYAFNTKCFSYSTTSIISYQEGFWISSTSAMLRFWFAGILQVSYKESQLLWNSKCFGHVRSRRYYFTTLFKNHLDLVLILPSLLPCSLSTGGVSININLLLRAKHQVHYFEQFDISNEFFHEASLTIVESRQTLWS